jgi:aminoglycoside phosphotransferase (APT) family kinase protein
VPATEAGFDPARLAGIVGAGVRVVADLTPPWAATTRTTLISAGGERYVVQLGARAAIARRAGLAVELRTRAPWLPVPEIVGVEIDGVHPFVVSRWVAGASGRELMGSDGDAERLGEAMGKLSREIAAVPAAGLRLSRTWSDGGRLAVAATRWLDRAARELTAAEAERLRVAIDRLPKCFAGRRPVFAHGDLAPVNVIVRDGRIAALLDLERARVAHPLFDAARWSGLVAYHHPDRWPAASRAFFAAAGLVLDDDARAAIGTLGAIQFLEMVATGGSAGRARYWSDMLRWAVEASPTGVFRAAGQTRKNPGRERRSRSASSGASSEAITRTTKTRAGRTSTSS